MTITNADLYAMSQESPTAYQLMPELCRALDMPLPIAPQADTSKRNSLPDPFEKVSQHL